MCSNWKNRTVSMGLSRQLSLIEEIGQTGAAEIVLSGGEPTLHPHLNSLISHAKQKIGRVVLITNGTVLAYRDAIALIKTGLDSVVFSIDSPFPHLHDYIRGVENAWEKSVHLAIGLDDFRKKDKYHFELVLNSVVLPENLSSLSSLHILIAKVRFDKVCLIIPKSKSHISLNPKELKTFETIYQTLKTFASSKGISLSISGRQKIPMYEKPLVPCFIPAFHALVREDGSVYVCCESSGSDTDLCIGKVSENSFQSVWNSEAAKTVRKKAIRRETERCKGCKTFDLFSSSIYDAISCPDEKVSWNLVNDLSGKTYI